MREPVPWALEAVPRPPPDLETLAAPARAEGHAFLDRLAREAAAGTSAFDGPGEALLVGRASGALIAIGGIHRDPFLDEADVGRLRRLYVAPAWRRRGVGGALVARLLVEGRGTWRQVRLRTHDPRAAAFYEALGWHRTEEPDATHVWTPDTE